MPRRILLLLTDLEIGGTPTVVRELAIRLAREKDVHIHVACLDKASPVSQELLDLGIATTALNATGPTDLSALFRLWHLIQSNHFDTVFSFLIHANAAAAIVSPFCQSVRFLQSIQTTQPNPSWHWFLQSIVQFAAEQIIVPSPSVAVAANEWADIPWEKIQVISNTVESSDFTGLNPTGTSRIGFIGRLDPVKRIGDMIAAMSLLPPETTLHIFGQGPEQSNIEAAIHRLNLAHRVTLHGPVRRPAEALGKIDLLVLPSAAEGFGLVLIEAMAAGIPVVATNVPGINDVIDDGENGLLVPPADSPALAAAIARIQSNAELRDHLIAGGKRTVAERFTWDRILPEYREILGLIS